MNIPILIANILAILAFLIHTFIGDKEVRILQPPANADGWTNKQEKWTMIRCGWHWVSFDLLIVSIALLIINFTDYFDNEKLFLQIISIYLLILAVIWIIVILISKPFEKRFIKLGQWLLLLILSGLIYWGTY